MITSIAALNRYSQTRYYLTLLLAFSVLWIVSLGGGVWGQSSAWYVQVQHQMFELLCHQLPQRSFWIGGQPMAVCSRCFGIYSSLFAGWVVIPWSADFIQKIRWGPLRIFLVAVGINALDAFMNLISVWQTPLAVRFVLGVIIGGTVVLILYKQNE